MREMKLPGEISLQEFTCFRRMPYCAVVVFFFVVAGDVVAASYCIEFGGIFMLLYVCSSGCFVRLLSTD